MSVCPAYGGGGKIRTSDTFSGMTLFKSAAINRSATPPPYAGLRFVNTYKKISIQIGNNTGAFNHSATPSTEHPAPLK